MRKLLWLAVASSGCLGSDYVRVEIEPNPSVQLEAGRTLPLEAYGYRDDGARDRITPQVSWRTEDASVVIIRDSTLAWVSAGHTRICTVFETFDVAIDVDAQPTAAP
jgi:hypothetical protein